MCLRCVAVGVANIFEILDGIDANRKTTRKCSAVVAVSMTVIVPRLPAAPVLCVSASVSCSDLSFACILIYHV